MKKQTMNKSYPLNLTNPNLQPRRKKHQIELIRRNLLE
jgi:hypothetical protein